jgi:hypothetical protein
LLQVTQTAAELIKGRERQEEYQNPPSSKSGGGKCVPSNIILAVLNMMRIDSWKKQEASHSRHAK